MRPLVWFRADLRVRDNTALSEACRAADEDVIAVFTICPAQWADHDWAPVKVDLLLRCLRDLSAELAELNIPLLILEEARFSGVPKKLLALAKKHDCDGIWFNDEYEINERRRDERVAELFEESERSVHRFTDQVVLPPESVKTNDGGFYTVFTPYKKKWIGEVKDRGGISCQRKPPQQDAVKVKSDDVPEKVKGFDFPDHAELWKSGEDYAVGRLRRFTTDSLKDYADARDFPAKDDTSRLSPYLALGVLSPRQCLDAALRANQNRLDSGSKGATTWISEIIWREFYRQVLVGYPRVCRHEPFDLRTKKLRWRESEKDLERWKEGRTGIPIVDAAMRQLRDTGWMHNRLRMVVAMFLSKNLFLDWRLGERHFMRHLVDGDLASNNGGWQWSASTGTDAAPYFRIFNPVSQSERFDPEGTFIREYVPELEGVEGNAIHLPGARAPEALDGVEYPEPIVDLKRSRQEAIDRFKSAIS